MGNDQSTPRGQQTLIHGPGPDYEAYLTPRPTSADQHIVYSPFFSPLDNRKFQFKAHPFDENNNHRDYFINIINSDSPTSSKDGLIRVRIIFLIFIISFKLILLISNLM
jgi:hypothetical protein